VDGKAAAPGESLEFLAHIRGWQSEARRQRRDQLLQLGSIGLRVALEGAAGEDIFFIPQVHFTTETPALVDDEGWWYRVRSVIWIRRCRKCEVRKEQKDFAPQEWSKKQPAICVRCDRGKGVTRVSSGRQAGANGSKSPPIPQRGDPEQPMRTEALSEKRTRRRKSNGAMLCME